MSDEGMLLGTVAVKETVGDEEKERHSSVGVEDRGPFEGITEGSGGWHGDCGSKLDVGDEG